MMTGMSIMIFCCEGSAIGGESFCWSTMSPVEIRIRGWRPIPMNVGPMRSGRERSCAQRNETWRSSTEESRVE